jgi:hypothetical protein
MSRQKDTLFSGVSRWVPVVSLFSHSGIRGLGSSRVANFTQCLGRDYKAVCSVHRAADLHVPSSYCYKTIPSTDGRLTHHLFI